MLASRSAALGCQRSVERTLTEAQSVVLKLAPMSGDDRRTRQQSAMAPGKVRLSYDPRGPPVPDEPSIFLFAGSIHPLLFEAGCGVAIATAGRTSGQCYYRVPRLRAVGQSGAVSTVTVLFCQRIAQIRPSPGADPGGEISAGSRFRFCSRGAVLRGRLNQQASR
jgi:hypothetical protein